MCKGPEVSKSAAHSKNCKTLIKSSILGNGKVTREEGDMQCPKLLWFEEA